MPVIHNFVMFRQVPPQLGGWGDVQRPDRRLGQPNQQTNRAAKQALYRRPHGQLPQLLQQSLMLHFHLRSYKPSLGNRKRFIDI